MVAISLILLGLTVYAAVKLTPRLGRGTSIIVSVVGFLVVFGIVLAVMPSLGDLSANVAHSGQFGFARAATETPQPITNILSTPLTIDGRTVAPGQIVYPGFDADVLWKFRWYSLLNQTLIWLVIGLVFGALVDRLFDPAPRRAVREEAAPVGV